MRPLFTLFASACLVLVLAPLAYSEPPQRKDALGDPLPAGALMRLGTTRFRVEPLSIDARLRLTSNGKRIAAFRATMLSLLYFAYGGIEESKRLEVKLWRRLPLPQRSPGWTWALAISSDGVGLALTQNDEALVLLEFDADAFRNYEDSYRSAVADVAFAADGKTLWSVGQDGSVVQWDAAAGKELRRLEDVPAAGSIWRQSDVGYRTFRFSRGARYVVCGGDPTAYRIAVRDTATGKEVFAFAGPFGWLACGGFPAGFSTDGTILAAAQGIREVTDQPAIRLWDVQTGRERPCRKGYKPQAEVVTVSPEGKAVLLVVPPRFDLFEPE